MRDGSQEYLDRLLSMLREDDERKLRAFLQDVNPADIAEVMELLEDQDRSRVIFALDSQTAAEVIVLLDERVRDEVVDDLSGDRLAEMVSEMPPDDAADVVGELTDQESDELLERLPEEQSEQIERLLGYDENTAGGLMNPDLLRVPHQSTVRETIHYIRRADVSDDEALVIYATNERGNLVGTVSPRRLLISAADRRLSDILEPDPVCVTVDKDQEDVVQLFRKYDLASLPVVDEHEVLVGHITVDDVLDVAAEEADEDIYFMAGTDPAELETASVFRAAGIRMVWLVPSFFFLAGTMAVIATSKAWFTNHNIHLALMACVPLIGALAGCCSVQSSTVITRGLATGELAGTKIGHVFNREGRIALIMAVGCALMALIIVAVVMPLLQRLGWVEPLPLHTVVNAVGLGMLASIVTASILGISLPFAFRGLGIDPAIAAGPVVTAANDVICVTLYLLLARWVVVML